MIDKMNERLTIEKSKAYTDKAGNHRNAWEDCFSCFTYASTYELQESGDEVKQENRSVVFTVRWCRETAAVTSTGYRIRFRGEVYSILSVDPMNYQKQGIKLHCRKEAHP